MSDTELTTAKINDTQLRVDDFKTGGPTLAKAETPKRSRKPPHAKSRKAAASKKQNRAARAGSKQDLVLQMLRQRSGASINDIVAKTGWQPHSARGFLSGVVRKKLNLPISSVVAKDGVRHYRVASTKPAKS